MALNLFQATPLQALLSHYYQPTTPMDTNVTVHVGKNIFRLELDVQHFKPDEVNVKVLDDYVIVEGCHEEKEDEHGYISRKFVRRYKVPEGFDVNALISSLSSDGVLTITAPKLPREGNNERNVPIIHTGALHCSIKGKSEERTKH